MNTPKTIKQRLEYLRGELHAERISYAELAELQSLAPHIESGDVELFEAAGIPEFPGKPNLLIVHLYGDGDTLRVIEDTPANEKLVAEWQEHDREHCQDDTYQPFAEYMENKGVELFCTRQLDLGPC